MKDELKGRIELNTVVIIVVLFFAVVIFLSFFFGIWNITIPGIHSEQDIQSECAKWQLGGCSESLNVTEGGKLKYPILNKTYGTNLDRAREFCNCPD